MNGLFMVVAVVAGIWALAKLGRLKPHEAKAFRQKVLGGGLIGVAAFFMLHNNLLIAVPLFGFGAGLLGWQKLAQHSAGISDAQPHSPPPNAMEHREALQVLGLRAGASRDEINQAYKRLQRANHPDAGGSTYLAAKINQARDVLLKG